MVNTVRSALLTLATLLIATSPATAASRDAFLELSADKAEVYVQEQLILSVQLYFSGALVQGDLSEPSHPDAIIERLGNQRESTQVRDGTRYQVIERRYAIFPQSPGTLTLPALRFEGHVRDSSRRLQAVQDSQQLYDVPVKPIPDAYPAGEPWLPARNLTLSADGLPDVEQLEAGRNLTRQLTLQAEGLPAEALPPFPQAGSPAIRQYPDQPARHTETTPEGLEGVLQQSFALVPVKAGPASVPELTVHWWNTDTDRLEQATLPARQYQITGSQAVVEPPAPDETSESAAQATNGDEAGEASPGLSVWFWSTVVLAVLWLLSLGLWWRSRGNPGKTKTPTETTHHNEKRIFEQLIQAINQGSPRVTGLLLHWAAQKYPGQRFAACHEAVRHLGDNELEAALAQFEESLYSMEGRNRPVPPAHRKRLLQAVKRLDREPGGAGNSKGLPPLYPPGLSQ